jgi:hypothetical protein
MGAASEWPNGSLVDEIADVVRDTNHSQGGIRMKRLRITGSMSVVRRGGAKLAAVAAGLVALAAFAAVPAVASHDARGDGPDARGHRTSFDAVVNFRRNAIYSCFGADNTGTPTANTANITASFTTVRAVVTVHAPAGTTVFGELTQSGCVRLKFFSFTVPASGVGTATVTDFRISNDAFVSFSDTLGEFQVTPDVVFFP